MKLLIISIIITPVFCTQYYVDVNEYREPLTMFDIASKTVKYCIHMNNRTLDNSYLLGTWYTIYKFSANLVGYDEYCKTTNFTSPTREDIEAYKTKYDLQNETFSFDNAVLCSQPLGDKTILKGIVAGDKTAKYYFLDPKSVMRLMAVYDVHTYKPVDNDYMIYYECKMRGHVKYLMSRRKNQTDAELEKVLEPLYELKGYGKERNCFKRKVVSTTPYF